MNFALFKRSVLILTGYQLLAVFMLSLAFWLKGSTAGISALLGGVIGVGPGLLFALQFFKRTGARAAHHILKTFYLGEMIKLLLSALLFTLVFQWSKVQAIPLFLVFIVTQLVYWLVLLKSR